MQRISLIDETFDINFTFEYNLSIQLSLDGFSFSILDQIQNKVIYLYHQELFEAEPEFLLKRIKAIYDESDLLQLPFKKTRIIIVAPNRTTLVPSVFFQEENKADYLKTALLATENRSVQSSPIRDAGYCAVFDLPQIIFDFFREKHPSAELQSNLSIVYPQFAGDRNLLKVTIYKKQIVITAVGSEGLQFHNCFFYDGEQDMLYYILGAVKYLAFEPEKIVLDGIVNKHETIYHRLRQYFKEVEIATNPSTVHFSYLLEKLPDARFINLFNSLA
ncbi:DUF3822 family protein [Mangrovibacterium marinum]|uniref:Uncharacterized protein DUF3822 n=1 Tax=Mangrovibacterium marinum TaxID=1639118 RepID=A0A2T5BUE2_9BACT|nr:DUF3822 family protein [Mangrovibacterium marinum]PTN03144.1 uncharacterized protein DUF3822 [Mangrovibacterium marinum]